MRYVGKSETGGSVFAISKSGRWEVVPDYINEGYMIRHSGTKEEVFGAPTSGGPSMHRRTWTKEQAQRTADNYNRDMPDGKPKSKASMDITTKPQSDGTFAASLKYNPKVMAYGDTKEEAVENLKRSVEQMGGYRVAVGQGKQ
jgi:hypothetical protein